MFLRILTFTLFILTPSAGVILTPNVGGAQPAAELAVVGGAFCKTGVTAEAETAVDRLFAEANRVAEKIQACESLCAPQVNPAEFCAYGTQLVYDSVALTRLAGAASDAARLFDQALLQSSYATSVLSADFSSTAFEMGDLIDQAIASVEATTRGDTAAMPDETRWRLAARDLDNASMLLAILASTGLATGDVAALSRRLDTAATEFKRIYNDIHKAIKGAEVLTPRSAEALAVRLGDIRAATAWVRTSFEVSAENTSRQVPADIPTNATALPPGAALAPSYQDASDCFTRLSLTLGTGSEAVQQSRQMLGTCRPFDECRPSGPLTIPDLSVFESFLAHSAEAAKMSAAVTSSMCLR